MLGGERNGRQSQRTLDHQQREDQDVSAGGGRPHAWAKQTTFEQQHATHETHQARRAAANHCHLLFHFNRQPRFIHPVRRQHTEEVTGEDPQNPEVEQV